MNPLRWLIKRRMREQDLNDEIQAHFRMAIGDAVDRGEAFNDAVQSAQRQFGNVSLIKEVTREMWAWTSLERLGQDLRYAGRLLRKSPGFTVVAISSMALGIGANTAVFSLMDAVMLRSLPVRSSNELVVIGDPTRVASLSEGSGRTDIFSYPFYECFRLRNHVFTDVYASAKTEHLDITLGDKRANADAQSEAPQARFVTGNYFSILGVPAVIGRTFTEQEVRIAGGAPVVVISYGYWTRKFARDPGTVGRRLLVNGSSFTIIGVTPPEFFGDIVGRPTDIWFPITMQAQANPGRNYLKDAHVSWVMIMGRLKPNVSQVQSAAVTNVIAPQLFAELYGSIMTQEGLKRLLKEKVEVSSGAKGFSRLRREFSVPLIILMGIVALVLLICCANVANLQLARTVSRGREMGLRLAVGAGQTRLIRQLLTESLMLSIMGGAIGLLLAQWGSRLLLGLISQNGQLPVDVHLDRSVLAFTAGVSILTGLLFGLAPALQSTRLDLISNLKESKAGQAYGFSQKFGKALIVSQIVFSLMLLVGAGLFIRTLRNLQNADVGYSRKGLLLVEIDSQTADYKDNQIDQLTTQLMDRLQNLPGIQTVTVSENGLFSGTDSGSTAEVEGYAYHSESDKNNSYDRVGPNYFEVAGTPVLMGRGIEARDAETAPMVAVINEKMAQFYFPHTNPIGRHIFEGTGAHRIILTIIGVVRDAKQNNLREPAPRRFYTSFFQHTDEITDINFEIRTQIHSSVVAESVRRTINSFDPHLPITSLKTADALIDETLDQEKLIAKLSSFFGVLALVLAAIGLYGVMSYITVRRTAEIGIRMALGAPRSGVIGMVLRETLRLVIVGLAIGTVASVFATKLLSKTLFGLSAFDPITTAIAVAVITVAAAAASYLPAWRASRIDPTVALRCE